MGFNRELGGTLSFMTTGGKSYCYLTDALGSVIGLADIDGNKVDSCTYSPYGVRILARSTEPVALRMLGRPRPSERDMARFFENLYGSDKAIKRNAVMVIVSTLVLYVISAILWTKGGWGAAFAPLLVAVVVDALCITVWLSFRSQHR